MMNPFQWMGGNRDRVYEGENDQRIREADGYRLKRINETECDVARFSALLEEHSKAPEVTRRRIYFG